MQAGKQDYYSKDGQKAADTIQLTSLRRWSSSALPALQSTKAPPKRSAPLQDTKALFDANQFWHCNVSKLLRNKVGKVEQTVNSRQE